MKRLIQRLLGKRRPVRHGLGISFGSVLFILGAALIGLAGLDADNNMLMILFSLCTAALVLDLLSGWRTLRGLTVQRVVPDVLVAGQPFVIRYAVANTRRWGCARCLRLADVLPKTVPVTPPEAFIPIIRPGRTVILSVPVLSRLRGRVKFSTVRVATGFPFGVFRKHVALPLRHDAVVFPALAHLLADIKTVSRSSDVSSGRGAPARIPGDEEFYGIREYRIGDNPRRIHWRSSARTGQLMIREMAPPGGRQLWCVVNTRVDPDAAAQIDRLELAISGAATVICAALERGVKIGLICNGEPLLVLPPGGGRAHRPRLLRELAIRTTNPDDPLAPHIQRLAWPARWRGRCLLFGAVDSDDLLAARQLLTWAVGPTSAYVPDTPAFNALFRLSDADPPHRGDDGQPAMSASHVTAMEEAVN